MRDEYDFGDAKKRPEVARRLGAKKAVTIRLDEQVVDYFRDLGKETGDPMSASTSPPAWVPGQTTSTCSPTPATRTACGSSPVAAWGSP